MSDIHGSCEEPLFKLSEAVFLPLRNIIGSFPQDNSDEGDGGCRKKGGDDEERGCVVTR